MNRTLAAFSVLLAIGAAGACADKALQPAADDGGHKLGAVEQTWAQWPPLAAVPQPADTSIGDFGNKIASMPTAGLQMIAKDAGGGFIGLNACNEGTSTTWVMCFNSPVLDAGGLNAASAAPLFLPLRIPAGACASLSEPQAFSQGLSCYSSSTQSPETIGSAQNISIDVSYR